jgi:hypothetical protein
MALIDVRKINVSLLNLTILAAGLLLWGIIMGYHFG